MARAPVPPGVIAPPDPPLRDGDFVLRPWREDDIPAVAAACRDAEIQRWVPVPSPYTEDDARDYVHRCENGWSDGSVASFAIADACGGWALGSIHVRALNTQAERSIGQVGYWIAPEARGRGVARRALQLLAGWAFAERDFSRLQLLTDPENLASQRVAEAAGFVREGVLRGYLELRGRRSDGIMFGLLPEDLEGRS